MWVSADTPHQSTRGQGCGSTASPCWVKAATRTDIVINQAPSELKAIACKQRAWLLCWERHSGLCVLGFHERCSICPGKDRARDIRDHSTTELRDLSYFGEGKGIILHTKRGTKSSPVIILLTSPMRKGGIGEDVLRLMRSLK